MEKINYTKQAWKYHHYLERYKRHALSDGLACQECRGQGSYVADTIDFGDGLCSIPIHIYETCGWCEGTGKVIRWRRGEWLRMKKEEKRRK